MSFGLGNKKHIQFYWATIYIWNSIMLSNPAIQLTHGNWLEGTDEILDYPHEAHSWKTVYEFLGNY